MILKQLTAVGLWQTGPYLAPQKFLLSQHFRYLMRCKEWICLPCLVPEIYLFVYILNSNSISGTKHGKQILFTNFLHLMRCLNCWDNKNSWGAKYGPVCQRPTVKRPLTHIMSHSRLFLAHRYLLQVKCLFMKFLPVTQRVCNFEVVLVFRRGYLNTDWGLR